MLSVTDQQALQCLRRELAIRKSAYPKWVKSGRMRPEAMDHEIAAMEMAVWMLEKYMDLVAPEKAEAKAEAERDELQDLKLATLAALVQAGIAMLEENPITPSEVESAIRRLARERDSERARAERYLAAMREGVA